MLFTSFERYKRLAQVLDELGRVFEGVLAKRGVQWLTLTDRQRQEKALQVLRQAPVFWIWDNVEPIAGFPAGTPSAWSAEEQKELADFLREARTTKAKFLLTSRRDEREWLHDLPARIELPPMPLYERIEMTEVLAKKRGRRLEDVDDWRPLLRFTQGNPLTLTVLVGQALRDGLKSREQIEGLVRKLQAGEAVFDDEVSEGRTRSLAASLSYGFENAFSKDERKQLALLHLFQGFVQVGALRTMGNPESEWCLREVRGLTQEAGVALLDRAVEIGLLTALGGGGYGIHPALPWFFRRPFEEYYSDRRTAAQRAFVEAIAGLGDSYQYMADRRDVIVALSAEEANLLQGRSLARLNGWWSCVTSAMQGLRVLYDHAGRVVEWSRLVGEILTDFLDLETEEPLPGREHEWNLVTGYRVRLAREARRWEDAARLESIGVGWNRQRSAPILAKPLLEWDVADKLVLRSLAVFLEEQAHLQRERGSAACVNGYHEALALDEQIGDSHLAAVCAFNLGHAYKDLEDIRDLAVAEQWYQRSLQLRTNEDRIGRARCLVQLGIVVYERSLDAGRAGRSPEECFSHLEKAGCYCAQALEMLPAHAVRELATAHHQLGLVWSVAGQVDAALTHFRESIRYFEPMQDRLKAGNARFNAALATARAGRFSDARDWAQAALRDFQACENAEKEVVDTLKLLEQIESLTS